MKNKKLLKAIASLAVGAVMATGSLSLAACGGGAHKHAYDANKWEKDASTHWNVCTADGCDAKDKKVNEAAHSTTTPGAECSVCGYKVPGGQVNPDPVNPDPVNPDPVTKENVQLDVSDLTVGDMTAGSEILEGIKIVGTPAVDENGKKVIYNGEEVSVSKRIKLSQKFTQSESNASKSMGLEVKLEENATILVYAYSGTANAERDLAIYDGEKSIIGSAQSIGDGNAMNTAKFDVEANKTYYIGAHTSAGVNIYYIAVFYKDFNENWTPHEAVPTTCTAKGAIAYSNSNYGRYKNASDSIITYDAIAIADLGGHSYSLKENSITAPTASGTGSAVLTCATGSEELSVTLPALNDPSYTKDTSAAGLTSGQAKYTIQKEGVEISFVAEDVAPKEYEFVNRYSNLFGAAQSLGFGATNATTLAEGVKGYGTVNDSEVSGWSDSTYDVKTADGTLSVVDKSTKSSFAYILFDTAKTSGVYKITGDIKVNQSSGKWNVLQFVDGSETGLDGRFAALRSDSNKKWSLSLDGAQDTEIGTRYGAVIATTTTYSFEFVLDLDNNTITLKVGDTVLGNTSPTTVTLSGGWKGIKLQTGDSASRTIELSNFVIQERVEKTGA